MNTSSVITITLLLLATPVDAKNIYESGRAIKDTKVGACKAALDSAKVQALHQAGTNVFSKFESSIQGGPSHTTKNESYIQNLTYGSVTTVSSNETFKIDKDTGYIDCTANGLFNVDIGKLENQLRALNERYENDRLEEYKRNLILENEIKSETIYSDIRNSLIGSHTIKVKRRISCPSWETASNCKLKFREYIKETSVISLAKQRNIEPQLIKVKNVVLIERIDIQTSENEANDIDLIYDGNITVDIYDVLDTKSHETEIVTNQNDESVILKNIESAIDATSSYLSSILDREYLVMYNGVEIGSFKADFFDDCNDCGEAISKRSIELYFSNTSYGPKEYKISLGRNSYRKYNIENNAGYDNDYTYEFIGFGRSFIFKNWKGEVFPVSFDISGIFPFNQKGGDYSYVNLGNNQYSVISDKVSFDPYIQAQVQFNYEIDDDIYMGLTYDLPTHQSLPEEVIILRLGMNW